MMRAASILCGLLAIGLLGYAGYRYAVERDPARDAPLTVHEPDRDLGDQPCSPPVPVSFRISNNTAQAIRILGLVPG
jgi:hypothetical protein